MAVHVRRSAPPRALEERFLFPDGLFALQVLNATIDATKFPFPVDLYWAPAVNRQPFLPPGDS
eukprot:1518752-Pyramimonas_sp.AAC.1